MEIDELCKIVNNSLGKHLWFIQNLENKVVENRSGARHAWAFRMNDLAVRFGAQITIGQFIERNLRPRQYGVEPNMIYGEFNRENNQVREVCFMGARWKKYAEKETVIGDYLTDNPAHETQISYKILGSRLDDYDMSLIIKHYCNYLKKEFRNELNY